MKKEIKKVTIAKHKIALVTDSSSSLNPKSAEKLGIYCLRLPVIIDGVEYYEDETITYDEFVAKMRLGALPKTSMPAIGEVTELLEKLNKEYDYIIILPINEAISGTYQMISTLVAQHFDPKRFFVANNHLASLNLYHEVIKVKTMINQGISFNIIVENIKNHPFPSRVYLSPKNVQHLKRTGRLSASSALVAGLLGIIPVLSLIEDRKFEAHAKVRTFRKAIQEMVDSLQRDGMNSSTHDFYILHADNLAEATYAVSILKETFGVEAHVEIGLITPVIAAHTGLGAIGVCSVEK